MTVRNVGIIIGFGLWVTGLGCVPSEDLSPPTVYPVKGQVIYNGKPAVGVEVTLFPNDAPMIPRIPANPRGVTDAEGNFTITTFKDGDGAAEGGYQVLLRYPKPKKDGTEEVLEETTENDQFLGWYDAMHSTLTVRIKPQPNVLEPFKIPQISRPPEASQGVPGRN